IARLVEWIGANTPLAEIHDDLLAHLVARRRGEPRRANPKFGLVSAATGNRTVTQLLKRIFTPARQKVRIPHAAERDWGGHILKEPAERTRELRFDEEAAIETAERADGGRRGLPDPRFASYGRDSHVAGVEESARCEGDAGPRRYQNDDALRSRSSRRRGRSDDGTCHRRSRTARRAREPHGVPRKSRAIPRGGA